MSIVPIPFVWNGEMMVPMKRLAKLCDKQFVVGEEYRLGPIEERSHNSHAHFFSCVNEAWKQLPEKIANRFPTADHLRKYALIRTGFYEMRCIALPTESAANKVAAFIKPMDDYALIVVTGLLVEIYTALSQSYRAMPGGEFQRSKSAVLEYLSDLISVESEVLSSEAGRAA